MGNKMGYQYLGAPEDAKRNMLHAGKKTATILPDVFIPDYPQQLLQQAQPPKLPPKQKRKPIGYYWKYDEKYVWYEGDDPVAKGATRYCRLPN